MNEKIKGSQLKAEWNTDKYAVLRANWFLPPFLATRRLAPLNEPRDINTKIIDDHEYYVSDKPCTIIDLTQIGLLRMSAEQIETALKNISLGSAK